MISFFKLCHRWSTDSENTWLLSTIYDCAKWLQFRKPEPKVWWLYSSGNYWVANQRGPASLPSNPSLKLQAFFNLVAMTGTNGRAY